MASQSTNIIAVLDSPDYDVRIDETSVFAVKGIATLIAGEKGNDGIDGKDGKDGKDGEVITEITPEQLISALQTLGAVNADDVESLISTALENHVSGLTEIQVNDIIENKKYLTSSDIIELISISSDVKLFSEKIEKTVQKYKNIDGEDLTIRETIDPTLFENNYIGKKTIVSGEKNFIALFSALGGKEMQQGLHSVGGYKSTVALYGGQVLDEKNLNTGKFFEIGILGENDWRLEEKTNGINFFGLPLDKMEGGDVFFERKGLWQKTENILILKKNGDIYTKKGKILIEPF